MFMFCELAGDGFQPIGKVGLGFKRALPGIRIKRLLSVLQLGCLPIAVA